MRAYKIDIVVEKHLKNLNYSFQGDFRDEATADGSEPDHGGGGDHDPVHLVHVRTAEAPKGHHGLLVLPVHMSQVHGSHGAGIVDERHEVLEVSGREGRARRRKGSRQRLGLSFVSGEVINHFAVNSKHPSSILMMC